jgi:hypothetical protein
MAMKNDNIKIATNRNFGIVFFLFFLIITLYPLLKGESIVFPALFISIIFLILGLLNSSILTPLNKVWFKFGIFMGNIISPLVMALLFYFVITPTSLLLKIFRKDILLLKKNNKKTYWIKKSKIRSKMKNQF